MRTLLKLLLSLGLVLALGGVAFAAWMGSFAQRPLEFAAIPLEVTVRPGASLSVAARELAAAGVAMRPWQFALLGRVRGSDAGIKAGTYRFTEPLTPLALLDKLVRGDSILMEIMFIEGWTFRQLRQALDAHPDLRHDTAALPDTELLARIGATPGHPEGRFFPDKYLFAKGASDIDVLRQAYAQMERRLAAAWGERDPSVPLASPYEALILASIVEKETGQASDRAMIAGVFANRLRTRMLLQTDPTVIYGLGESFDGNLRRRDLLADGPYNTYTRPGLPPTPIALPGQASLSAAVKPAKTDALYFVARGDGSSQFSRSLDEHNRAVSRYQRGGR
ncbi:MAG: endolytic transglycosylase MltG [Burkholderiales bacterium]|jgi:UPF0755 protein|nr:endolytic transglycosylase MltG [Burkholderiales bacterium]